MDLKDCISFLLKDSLKKEIIEKDLKHAAIYAFGREYLKLSNKVKLLEKQNGKLREIINSKKENRVI